MLAIQRPSMGSSKPPNLDMPFGYSFDTSSTNFPFPSPPAPAPGPSLLDDNESKFLDSFFDGVSSNHFDYNFFNNGSDGAEIGMGWDELPPAFVGTSSSYGQQPQMGSAPPEMSYADLHTQITPAPSIPPTTSADILAAATLLSNGSNGRAHSLGGEMIRGQLPMHPPSVRPHSISEQSQPRTQSGFLQRNGGDDFMRDNFYTDMIFGNQSEAAMRQQRVEQKVDIRWGSDSGFGNPQGFVPPPSQDLAASERSHLQAVETAFSLNLTGPPISSSAETTRPSSPSRPRLELIATSNFDEGESRPRKRRKSRYKEEEDDEDEEEAPSSAISRSSAKRRKSTKRGLNQSPNPDSDQGHKHRKSSAPAPKPARENLTEDQKRENHIKSEQKRRTLIREGFEDLNELVPGLRGGGFSKSAVLIMAADWLEELMQGNEVLQARLDQMEGR